MKAFKKIFCLMLIGCAITTLSACTTTQSITFHVNTGDSIKVKAITSEGYKIFKAEKNDVGNIFNVAKDGEIIFEQAGFNDMETYDQQKTSLEAVDGTEVDILDTGEKDGNEYIFYSWDGGSTMEYLYTISITGSNTSVMLMSTVSEDAARECFDALTLSLE